MTDDDSLGRPNRGGERGFPGTYPDREARGKVAILGVPGIHNRGLTSE